MSRYDVETVEVDRDAQVTVGFADGVTARFGLGELRLACPCADCNGKRQRGESVQPAIEQGAGVTITRAELSGAFGLDLDWSDGHRTGIYGWSMLRDGLDGGTLGSEV